VEKERMATFGRDIGSDEAQIRLTTPRIGELMDLVPTLEFCKVTSSVWNTIQDEGLNEEQNESRRAGWEMTILPISPEEANNLRAFEDTAIELFNSFDIALKEHYDGALIDLIDYDTGIVHIVRKCNKSLKSPTKS
jgi:hypothetical protein